MTPGRLSVILTRALSIHVKCHSCIMALAFLGAIFSALSTGLDIIKQFRTESASMVVGSGHGSGFWDFCSYSSVGQIVLKADKANQYVAERLIPRIIKCESEQMKAHKDDIISELQDIADYAELSIGETNRAFTTTSYSKNSGKLWFYVYTFNALTDGTTKAVQCSTMHIEVELRMAQDWLLVNHLESSFMKAKNTFEIQYLPKGIEPTDVQKAIAIAIAPAVVGLIEMPERFVKIMGAVINSTEPAELPKYSSETIDKILEQYNQMLQRRSEQDKIARDAVDEFGKKDPTLKPETGKDKNEWEYNW